MKLRIFKPTESPIQAGRKNIDWCCIFLEEQYIDKKNLDLSNKISKNSTKHKILKFTTKEAALNYAKKLGYEFELITPVENRIEKKHYIP